MPFIVCELYFNKKWHRLKSRQKGIYCTIPCKKKCKKWVEFTYSDGNGDPWRGGFLAADVFCVDWGCGYTGVHEEFIEMCALYANYSSHKKKHVERVLPCPGSALRGASLCLAAMLKMGFEGCSNLSFSRRCRFGARSDCVAPWK